MLKQKKISKIISILCAFCMFITILPCMVSAESDIKIEIYDAVNDIITVSGSAPNDAMVSIKILNPGVSINEATSADFNKVQFFDVVFSENGTFSRNIKIKTGTAPNKIEGKFTVLISIDGELKYSNDSFVFYSNDTKQGYIEDIQSGTEEELLTVVSGDVTKIEKIFETYSVFEHELYNKSEAEDLADVICRQENRSSISNANDLKDFLVDVLVLNAFENSTKELDVAEGIAYAEIWAANDEGTVSELYTDKFANDLSGNGKSKVKSELLDADWSNAQFSDIYDKFESSMLYHLIKSNIKLGSGHIEDLVIGTYENEYNKAGFDTELLKAISDKKEKSSKLNSVLESKASNITALAEEFNKIMKEEYKSGDKNTGANGSTSGGGGGGGFAKPTATPAPTDAPVETPEATTSPDAAYPFEDMKDASWASEAVEYLYKEGIVNGRSEGVFAPAETVTRAELVKMIVEALDVEDGENKATFSDVNESDWYALYIATAASAGIVNGDNGAFRPNGAVTREDAALIIFRALGLEIGGEIDFSDAGDISDYAKEAIAAMVNSGFVNGMGDGNFAPKATLTRAQAAQLIYNAVKGGTNK